MYKSLSITKQHKTTQNNTKVRQEIRKKAFGITPKTFKNH